MKTCDIFLTNKCNKDCSFCFVKEKDSKQELDIDDFKKIVVPALQKNKIDHVALIGGEPTIYKNLFQVIQILNKNQINYEIFSNGLFNKEIFDNIDIAKVSISVHLPSNANEEKRIVENMIFLNEKKAIVKLRDVVTDNYNFHKAVKFIRKNKGLISGIRFKIAQPNQNKTNDYVTDISKIKKRLLSFLKIVNKLNIHISNCCFIPFCEFSDQELDFLRKINYLSGCRRVFYIDTDLSVKMCPFHNNIFCELDELKKVINNKNKIKAPLFNKCLHCKYYLSDECIPCFSLCDINIKDMMDICGLD